MAKVYEKGKIYRTASMYLVYRELNKQEKVLLIFHPKFNVWLPPGGHVEYGEGTWQALRREMKEEIAYDIGDGIIKQLDERATRYRCPFFIQIEDHGDHKVEDNLFMQVVDKIPSLESPEGLVILWFDIDRLPSQLFENTREHIEFIDNVDNIILRQFKLT